MSLKSDDKSAKGIHINFVNNLIFGCLNINTISEKFNFLWNKVNAFVDERLSSENKLDDGFAEGQFLIECSHAAFSF